MANHDQIVHYKDCLDGRATVVREIMEEFEDMCKKYNISDVDFNRFRSLVRSRSFILNNLWHRFLANAIDAKFLRKVNETGEQDGVNKDK